MFFDMFAGYNFLMERHKNNVFIETVDSAKNFCLSRKYFSSTKEILSFMRQICTTINEVHYYDLTFKNESRFLLKLYFNVKIFQFIM